MSEYESATYALARLEEPENEGEETEQNFLRGRVDGLAALRQTTYLLLQTEQGEYEIYPEFGVRLRDLVGRPMAYVIPEVERRLREALLADERVLAVEDFQFDCGAGGGLRGALSVSFTIKSIYGSVESGLDIKI